MSILIAALLAQAAPVPVEGMMIVGAVPTQSCIAWTANKNARTSKRYADEEWIAGYLVGLQFENRLVSTKSLLRPSDDLPSLVKVVDDFCAQNPLHIVAEGAQFLRLELFKRPQN